MTPNPINGPLINRALVIEKLTRLALVWEAMVELGGIRDRTQKEEIKQMVGQDYALETAGNPAYSVCAEDLRELIRELQGPPTTWPEGGLPRVTR